MVQLLCCGNVKPAEVSAKESSTTSINDSANNTNSSSPKKNSPLISGGLVQAAIPDTVEGFYSLTTTAGSPKLTVGGAAFTKADVGKLITCMGAGPNEGRLTSSIIAVTSATQITLAASATQSMTDTTQKCFYGSDQYSNIQSVLTYGSVHNLGWHLPAGKYLISKPLTALPPANNNPFNEPPPLGNLDPGAVIVAMAPMTAVLTYGGTNSDYSQVLRSATFGGGTLDGNFLASYGADIPFYVVATRQQQVTKNTLLAVARWGRVDAPASSGGALDVQNAHLRDIGYVTVTGITNANPPTVTTAWDHGYTTGALSR